MMDKNTRKILKLLNMKPDRFKGVPLKDQVEILKTENEALVEWIEWTIEQVQKLAFQAHCIEETLLFSWPDEPAPQTKKPTQDE